MNKFVFISVIVLFSNFFYACDNNNEDEIIHYVDAIVKNLGDMTIDGCGWVIEISDSNYRPLNLTEKFKADNLKIKLTYDKMASVSPCGFSQPIKEINIKEITKR